MTLARPLVVTRLNCHLVVCGSFAPSTSKGTLYIITNK